MSKSGSGRLPRGHPDNPLRLCAAGVSSDFPTFMFTWEVPSRRIKMPTSPTPDVQRQPTSDENYHFTVLIRLPFPRGDFVDPPAVRDAKLPKVISI